MELHRWGRPTAAAASVLVLALACLPTAWSQEKLEGHSIGSPPDIRDVSGNWFLGGTVIPTKSNMIVSSGVPNRAGLLFHKFAVFTKDFEVNVALKITAPANSGRTTKNAGLAFWYVAEDVSDVAKNVTVDHLHNQAEIISNVWRKNMQDKGYDLLTYKSTYKGFGAFFTVGADGKLSISGLFNDNTKKYQLGTDIPTKDAFTHDLKSGEEFTVSIRFQNDKVVISIPNGGKVEVAGPVDSDGYLGMSVYSGEKGTDAADEMADIIEMNSLAVTNFDTTHTGEKIPERVDLIKDPEAEALDVLAASSVYKEHRQESEAIKNLTNMVFKLVVETVPMRMQMTRAIEALAKRITTMETSFEKLKDQLDKKSGHKMGAEFDAIKAELTSLFRVASVETKDRHAKLENLHADIEHVHKSAHSPSNIEQHLNKLHVSNKRTLTKLTVAHQKMFGVSIGAIAFIIVAGLALYNKFRCWEKKHVL